MKYILSHSAKGSTWSDHKYKEKVTTKSGKTRYVYADTNDVTEDLNEQLTDDVNMFTNAIRAGRDELVKRNSAVRKFLDFMNTPVVSFDGSNATFKLGKGRKKAEDAVAELDKRKR